MLSYIYTTIRNALLFLFMIMVFNGIKIGGSTVLENLLLALLFGAIMAAVPAMLKFFKLPVTVFAAILLSVILTFVFLFLLYSGFFGIGQIVSTSSNIGVLNLVLKFDALETVIAATLAISIAVVGLDWLSEQ